VDSNLNWDSNFNQSRVNREINSLLGGPPTSIPAQPPFQPSRGPTPNPPASTYRRTEHCRWQAGPAPRHAGVAMTSPSSSPTFATLADGQSESGARRSWPRRRGAPRVPRRIPTVHVPRAATAIRAAAETPRGSPNPSRLWGNHSPVRPPTRRRRRRSEGGRRRDWSRPWERRPPRRPEPPVGGAGPAVATRTCLPCFLYFHDVTPPPPSSSSPPTSRATALHQRLHYGSWPPR
jgi:hypothetical protein